jgi:uncharacterized protein
MQVYDLTLIEPGVDHARRLFEEIATEATVILRTQTLFDDTRVLKRALNTFPRAGPVLAVLDQVEHTGHAQRRDLANVGGIARHRPDDQAVIYVAESVGEKPVRHGVNDGSRRRAGTPNLQCVSQMTDSFDLAALRMTSGEGRKLALTVAIAPFELGQDTYTVEPSEIAVDFQISRTTAQGYALRVRFEATLHGACMRCLEATSVSFAVDSREVSQPGTGDELDSPYVTNGTLALSAWTRDALALMLPAALLCKPDCAGLCAVCGADLNSAGSDHHHESQPDSRWAKLSELKFDQ